MNDRAREGERVFECDVERLAERILLHLKGKHVGTYAFTSHDREWVADEISRYEKALERDYK